MWQAFMTKMSGVGRLVTPKFLPLMIALVAVSLVGIPGVVADEDEWEDGGHITGVVQALPSGGGFVGDWQVAGVTVHVTEFTRIEQEHGLVQIGATVKVEGSRRFDGSVDAWEIEVVSSGSSGGYEAKITGVVEVLPSGGLVGDWRVAGVTVHVTEFTRIEQEHGSVQIGSIVKVEGTWRPDGSLDAREVEVVSESHPSYQAKLKGEVESLPSGGGLIGDWRVAGVTVHVSQYTYIKQEYGLVQVGSFVKVEGTWRLDGSVDAHEVEVLPQPGPSSSSSSFGVLRLLATASAPPEAKGVCVVREFSVNGTVVREDLKVGVEHLLPTHTYDVFVDGVHAGAILTDAEGEGHLFLSSASIPGSQPLPPELSPVKQRQEIKVQDGTTPVLEGNFANARWEGGGHPSSEYLMAAVLLAPSGQISGLGVVEIKQYEQEFKLIGFGLPPSASITVVVDGVTLGVVSTNSEGFLRAKFSSNPGDEELPIPQEALPVSGWQHLELQDASGQVLAAGDFSAVVQPGTSTAPGQVRRSLGRPRP